MNADNFLCVRSFVRRPAALITLILSAGLVACASGDSDKVTTQPTATAVSAQPAMAVAPTLTANGPTRKAAGGNLLDLTGTWQSWTGSGSPVVWDETLDSLLIPASSPDSAMVIGVRRYVQPLAAGRTYTLDVTADNDAAAAVMFLYDAQGAIVPVPDTPAGGLRFATNGQPLTFSSPGNVAGFYLQVQNQWQAPTEATLTAMLSAGGQIGVDGGPNLVTIDGNWPDWLGVESGIRADRSAVVIPPPENGTGNRIGVQRFPTPLTANARYELSLEAASDNDAAALLFLFDADGQIMPFTDSATGITGPWVAATGNKRRQFVAPADIAGFAIQVQSGWLATAESRITPSLRLAGGLPPCELPITQPVITFAAESTAIVTVNLGDEATTPVTCLR